MRGRSGTCRTLHGLFRAVYIALGLQVPGASKCARVLPAIALSAEGRVLRGPAVVRDSWQCAPCSCRQFIDRGEMCVIHTVVIDQAAPGRSCLALAVTACLGCTTCCAGAVAAHHQVSTGACLHVFGA